MNEKDMDEVLPPPPAQGGSEVQGMNPPQQQRQYAPQPQQYPPPQPQYYRRGYGYLLQNPVYIALGIVISILLMWLGVLFYAIGIGNSNSTPFYQIALIFYSLGTSGISIVLLMLGIARKDLQQWIRAALIFSGALVITWGFVFLQPLFYHL